MNGVDRNNQLRKRMSVIRANQERTWRPVFLWILDVVLVNCYLLWKSTKRPIPSRKGHRHFRQALCEALLNYPIESIVTMGPPPETYDSKAHLRVRFSTRSYCANCRAKISQPRGGKRRQFGTDLTNQMAGEPRKRGRKTASGCTKCRQALCVRGKCWEEWHGLE